MRLQLRRSSLKPWNWSTRTWLFVIFVSAIISPAVSRWIWLWQVPDVTLPFDVEEFIGTETPKEQGAFAHYATAAKMLDRAITDYSARGIGSGRVWDDAWDECVDEWLIENSAILAEFELGTEMEHAGGTSLRTCGTSLRLLTFNAIDPSHQDLRNLLRLAQAEGLRCERLGNLDAAWRWYRAIWRLAEHTEESRLLGDYLVAMGIRSAAIGSVAEWAANPLVNAEQLRLARTEIARSTCKRPKLSDIMKAEYLETTNIFESELGADYLYPEWDEQLGVLAEFKTVASFAKRSLVWSAGQPELASRLLRQVLVNNLDQVDRPRHLWRNTTTARCPLVFELESEKRRRWGQLSTNQLQNVTEGYLGRRMNESSVFFHLGIRKVFSRDSEGIDEILRIDDVYLARLQISLAVHEYHRSHGEFPAEVEDLTPRYLVTVLADPFSSSGFPMNYRRISPEEAIVWSTGSDGNDDGGQIEGDDHKDFGCRINLKIEE